MHSLTLNKLVASTSAASSLAVNSFQVTPGVLVAARPELLLANHAALVAKVGLMRQVFAGNPVWLREACLWTAQRWGLVLSLSSSRL